ncbi:T9SS type A sorting domain-containing protein [Flavobacterium arcticum]|nr:GEVED domain-containing protein [Flavobacterium arcticum]KAF2507552.1 T9SS type A sorting domain-containing protein [Flavobacterium arcticum]
MKNITIKNALNFGKDSKRWLLGYLVLFALLSVTTTYSQVGTINIGSGTANSANRVPIYSCYNYTYSQQIVKASEYAANGGVAGNVTKVSYYYSSGGTNLANWANWTVYLGHTSKTEFTSDTDWEPLGNLTQVYSGAITPVAGNWFEITFTTPFNYDGTSNLIIAIDENESGYSCTANFGSYTGSSNTGIYYYSDGTNPDPASPPSGTRTSALARLQFFGSVASCLAPNGLASSGVSPNAATISWNAVTAASTGYDYYYSTTNTAPTSATTPSGSVASGTTTASLSGLMSNTQYYAWVRSACAGTDVSAWTSSISFTTLCDATDIPYYEDANSATTPNIPACVTIQNAGTGNNWTTASNPGYGFDSNVFRYSYSSNPANAWFYTQGLNLTAGVSYRLSYTYGNNSTFYTEKLKIGYGTSASDAGMTTILADHQDVTGASATDAFVDFTPTTTGVYYVGFNAYSAANLYYIYVDDISVILTPTCEPVTGVVATTGSFTSGNLAWNESASLPADGYEYYVSEDATPPTGATTVSGSVAAGIFTAEATGLTMGTTYYAWVRAVCSDSDSSPWEGPSSFYTGYCTPAPTTVDNDGIIGVAMGTINNVTSGEPGNYADYTVQSTDAAAGATVDFAITYGTGYTYGTKIWIDWNNDTDFDDEGELVYTGLSTNDNPTTLEGSFSVPADAAVIGSHTVRIGGTDNDGGGTPCYSGSYGSYEDYSINIFMPDPPAITEFTPDTYCAVAGDITITGTTLGNATLEIGGTAVTITSNTDTEIVASVPAGVSGTVSVTTVAGTDTTLDTFAVTEPAELTLSATEATLCLGNSSDIVTITQGASDFDIYEWSPVTGMSGNDIDGYVFNPSETTTYTLTASQSTGSCEISTEFVVTVNPVPTPVTVVPSETIACLGSPVELTAEGGETITAVDYCLPTIGSTGASGDYLNNFTFADITNNNSGDEVSDYTYYSDITANVVGGQTYDISLQGGSTTWSQTFRVWIDFNQDGVFAEDESVFNTTTGTTAVVNGTVTIPATAFNGLTRMRVGDRFSSTIGAGEACGHTGYGEWEDYNVMITGASSAVEYVWSPIDGLYEDVAGTVAYNGDPVQVVYAMPSATTTYTATVTTDLGCPASDSATINIVITPAPTGDVVASFTTAATIADLTATGTDVQWYDVATGGTPLSDSEFLSSGMYYATQTLNGCESQDRLAVTVTVPEMDWVNLQWPFELTIVQGDTGMVYAQGYEAGVTPGAGPGIGVMAWIGISNENTDPSTWTTWVPMMFNDQVGNNDEFVAAIGDDLEPGTYYYASRFQYLEGPYSYGGYNAGGGSFWNGADYVSGVLTVNCGTMAPVADASQAFCDAATVSDLAAEGEMVQWYATAIGGLPLAMDAAVLNGGTYYASQTIDCESLTRTAVAVTINVTPAPTGSDMQVFEDGATVAELMAMGNDIMWYDAAGNMLSADDALEDGAMYYASQTMNGCESQDMLAVTVTVNMPSVDYVNLQYPGEVTVSIAQSAMIYVQVYEMGVTEGTGPGVGVTAWVGISTEDTDPSTWTTWVPTTFNIQSGVNDEYVASVGSNLEPGTYYYASRVQLQDGPFIYGGFNEQGGNTWDGVTYVSGILNVLCDTTSPVGATEQVVVSLTDAVTLENIEVTGTDVVWYATEQDAIDGNNPLAMDTAVEEGVTYYATQTINGCTSVTSLAVTVTGVLNNGSFDVTSFNYYPNPVKDILTIQYSSEITSVAVFNMLGQKVMAKTPNTTDANLDMSVLSDGTYIVIINAGSMTKTIKIVKKQ